jgi:hypothetical protein
MCEFVLGLKSSNGIGSATVKGGFNTEALDGLKGENRFLELSRNQVWNLQQSLPAPIL